MGGFRGGHCASGVSSAVGGIGPFQGLGNNFFLPGSLAKRLRNLGGKWEVMKGNRKLKYLVFAFLLVLISNVLPLIYYYQELPAADSVNSGVRLNQLMSKFNTEFKSAIDSKAIPEKMICLSCLPGTFISESCADTMSSFIAKNLLVNSDGMLDWHLRNAYLKKAISIKYKFPEVSAIYFSILANIFNEEDLSSLCLNNFGKPCDQLQDAEFRKLQRSFLTGQMPPPDRPSDDQFSRCF